MQVAYLCTYEKREKGEQSREKLSSLALNINVCFVAIPCREDTAPAGGEIEWQRLPVWKAPRDSWWIMHDTKMFLFTHRYGFEPGFSFLFFRNLIHQTELDWEESHRSGGLDWGVGTLSFSTAGGDHPHHIHPIQFSPCCPYGDITWWHNLTPQFHSFSSIRLDWNFPAHFPGAVKWAVSHVSEPAPAHLL